MNMRLRFGVAGLALALSAHAQIVFEDDTTAAGIDDPVDVQGVAFADADDDGDPDLYLTLVLSAVLGQGNELYLNQGSDGAGGWVFSEQAVARGVSDAQTSFGCGWGDFDNDGDQDMLVASGANSALPAATHLYVNDGAGNFTNEAALRGITAPQSGRSVVWADYDNDGDLDFFLATPDLVLFGERYYLYNNDGGRFTDVTAAAGLTTDAMNTDSAAWADYDGDGDQDLYVVNHGVAPATTEANELWQNQLVPSGTATFVNVAPAAGVDDTQSSTGSTWGDCDNDGDLDLYVSTGLDAFSIFGINAPNRLYQNNGDGTFTDIAPTAGVNGADVTVRGQVSFSAVFTDFDNDGWLDIYVTNSRLELSPVVPSNVMLHNVGNCRFEEVDIGVNDSGSGQGTAVGDFDGDGWMDIFVANLLSGGSQTARLYRNASASLYPSRHWVHVDTVGVDSNRDGVGAWLELFVGGNVYRRHVYAGSGYLSQDSLEAEFGIGDATSAEKLVIHWPSGCVQTVMDPAVDALSKIIEDCTTGFDSASVADDPCAPGLTVDWEPATFASGSGHYEIRRGRSCLEAEASPEILPRPVAPPYVDAASVGGETWSYALLAKDDVNGTTARLCASGADIDGSNFVATPLALPNPVCPDRPVQLVATGPPGATFEWDVDGDGVTDLTGAATSTSWTAVGTHRVDLRTTSNGCTRLDSTTVDVRPDLAAIIDDDSLRVTRDAARDPVLSWVLLSGTGLIEVHRNVSDRFAWSGGAVGIPVVATPSLSPYTDAGLVLSPSDVAYYQVVPAACP